MLKYLVFSDLHLTPPGGRSQGLDPAERFKRTVGEANALHGDAAFAVLAGDLADDGEPDAYAVLRELLADLTIPWHATLGNHDNRDRFHAAFGGDGFVQHALDASGQRVIVLDSLSPGRVGGEVCDERLGWLAARLAEAQDRPVHIVMHHPPHRQFTFLDGYEFLGADAFGDVLGTHPDVRVVLAGHVHMVTSAAWRGVHCATLAGGHYSIAADVEGAPETRRRFDGPVQYAVVMSDGAATTVHFHDVPEGGTRLGEDAA